MNFKITNWGHSCILLETNDGIRLLFDPYITGNESAAVGVDDIRDIDAVIVTHGAFDHMGDAVEIVKKTGATLYCGPEVRDYALFNGVDEKLVRMLVWGTCLEHKDTGITVRSIEAKHLSYFKMGDTKITGMPMSYVVTLRDGTGIFFAGDTSIFSDMKLFGELYPVKYGFFGVPYSKEYGGAGRAFPSRATTSSLKPRAGRRSKSAPTQALCLQTPPRSS